MAKTAAERAKAYRDRQLTQKAVQPYLNAVERDGKRDDKQTKDIVNRDAVTKKRDENVTPECDERHESVTVPERDAPSVTGIIPGQIAADPDRPDRHQGLQLAQSSPHQASNQQYLHSEYRADWLR